MFNRSIIVGNDVIYGADIAEYVYGAHHEYSVFADLLSYNKSLLLCVSSFLYALFG